MLQLKVFWKELFIGKTLKPKEDSVHVLAVLFFRFYLACKYLLQELTDVFMPSCDDLLCLVTITIVLYFEMNDTLLEFIKMHVNHTYYHYHKLITICFIKINNEVIIFCDVNRQCNSDLNYFVELSCAFLKIPSIIFNWNFYWINKKQQRTNK